MNIDHLFCFFFTYTLQSDGSEPDKQESEKLESEKSEPDDLDSDEKDASILEVSRRRSVKSQL